MKRLVLLTSLTTLLVVVNACAAEFRGPTADKKPATDIVPSGAAARGTAKYWYVTYLDKAVGLTGEQKTAMSEIIQKRNKSMWDYQIRNAHRLRAAGNALLRAYRSMDGDAIAEAQSEYQDLHAPLHQLMRQSQDDLMKLLTPDQKARLREFQIMKAIESMTAPVQLSDDQLRQIIEAWPKADLHDVGPAVREQAVQQVLTPEQKIAIAQHRAVAFIKATFGPAQLTEEQLKQAEAFAAELVSDPTVAPNKLHKVLSDEIRGLLTPEQREVMKKPWTWNRAGPGGWGAPGTAPGNRSTNRNRKGN